MTRPTSIGRSLQSHAAALLLACSLVTACADPEVPGGDTTSSPTTTTSPDQTRIAESTRLGSTSPEPAPKTISTSSSTRDGVYHAISVTGFDDSAIVPTAIAFYGPNLHIFTGCHYATGGYRIADGRLHMDDGMVSTPKECETEDTRNSTPSMYDFISTQPILAVDGNLLTLSAGTGQPRAVVLQRTVVKTSTLLEGTLWWLALIERDGTSSGLPFSLLPTIRVADGRIEIAGSCNNITGDVTKTDTHLVISNVSRADGVCEGPRGELERELLSILTGAVGYQMNADSSLTIAGATSTLVFLQPPATTLPDIENTPTAPG